MFSSPIQVSHSETKIALDSLPQLCFLPQAAIERLLAEYFIDTSGQEEQGRILSGELCTDEVSLRKQLQDQYIELSQRYRRCLDSRSVIHLVVCENDSKQEVEVQLTFPRVIF